MGGERGESGAQPTPQNRSSAFHRHRSRRCWHKGQLDPNGPSHSHEQVKARTNLAVQPLGRRGGLGVGRAIEPAHPRNRKYFCGADDQCIVAMDPNRLTSMVTKVKILEDGKVAGHGTGFFWGYGSGNICVVTALHVLAGLPSGCIQITLPVSRQPPGPLQRVPLSISKDQLLSGRLFAVPDCDIAAIRIDGLPVALPPGSMLCMSVLTSEVIPTGPVLSSLVFPERIMSLGFPIMKGFDDDDEPVLRDGTTSRPVGAAFEKQAGILDMPTFPGCSGSPVFIYNDGFVRTKQGTSIGAGRFLFLGVLTKALAVKLVDNGSPEAQMDFISSSPSAYFLSVGVYATANLLPEKLEPLLKENSFSNRIPSMKEVENCAFGITEPKRPQTTGATTTSDPSQEKGSVKS